VCGIAGIHARVPLPASLPTGWAKELAPRGPDGVGFLWDAGAVGGLREGRRWPGPQSWTGTALVHRRLAILDRTRAGHQPMVSPDGRHVLVYNGEIYNHVELRQELETAGWKFKGSGDSEVLLAAWSMWGAACLPRLDGMFAFAVLDRELRILHLARDPFGIKPLCYAAGSDGFAFASTPVPLLELPWVSRRADLPRVQHYLGTANGLVGHGDRTMFADVRQVPAGHHMSVNLDDLSRRSQAYWKPPRRAKKGPSATHVRDAFLDNVRRHLRSDVPVGAALSGGIDSSSIVAAMRAVGGPELELHVFSYIPDDPAHSEEPYIDLVAAATGATVHKVQPSTEALQQDLEPLIRAHGEPFGSTSMYAQYCVFRAARAAGVPVLLDGQGADELLAGYLPFVGSQAAMLLRRGRWLVARRLVALLGAWASPGSASGAARCVWPCRVSCMAGWLDATPAAWAVGRRGCAVTGLSAGAFMP
jgi:asparagine synthase (glutamine-hydrolysing)